MAKKVIMNRIPEVTLKDGDFNKLEEILTRAFKNQGIIAVEPKQVWDETNIIDAYMAGAEAEILLLYQKQ